MVGAFYTSKRKLNWRLEMSICEGHIIPQLLSYIVQFFYIAKDYFAFNFTSSDILRFS